MTDSQAPHQPYTLAFDARVREVDGCDVVLEETYFYPEGGGQPADRGSIDGVEVVDVQPAGEAIVHTCTIEPNIEIGDRVACRIDQAFRTYCMRLHTASHALYGAGRRVLDDIGYGGFGIDETKARIDFETSSTIDDGVLIDLERLVNQTVWESREVLWKTYPRKEALDRPEIAFNAKTEEGLTGDTIRVVTIAGDDGAPWDIAACGGTHVSNTREIGPVTILGRSNPGEGLTRVELAVGSVGIDQRAAERRALFEAAELAGTAATDLPQEVARLQATIDEYSGQVDALRQELAQTRVAALEEQVVDKNGARWLVGAVGDLDPNALGTAARDAVGTTADVVALLGEDDHTVLVVAATAVDAAAVVEAVTREFGGGGGGSSEFAQGGGIPASPTEIVQFLRE